MTAEGNQLLDIRFCQCDLSLPSFPARPNSLSHMHAWVSVCPRIVYSCLLPCDAPTDDELILYGEPAPYEAIAAEIESVEGVVTHGLFTGVADAVVIASEDGPQVVERMVLSEVNMAESAAGQ